MVCVHVLCRSVYVLTSAAECGDGSLPPTTSPLASYTGRETTESCLVGESGSAERRIYKEVERGGERGRRVEDEGEKEEEGGEEEGEEEREVVRMKCGCTLDQLEAHMGWGFECQCPRGSGGSADPKLPVSAKPRHSVCCFLIPCISVWCSSRCWLACRVVHSCTTRCVLLPSLVAINTLRLIDLLLYTQFQSTH